MERLESIKLEADENGWELEVETDSARYRFNVHLIASTDELEQQLQAALDQINDWKAGA